MQNLKEELRRTKEAAIMPSPPFPSPFKREENLAGQSMDIDTAPNDFLSVILPPREEWPPVLRPAIQGNRRVLTDDEDDEIVTRSNTSSFHTTKAEAKT
ncbi:hypothetical protein PUN28_003631 [Cardiocondyla obscurior]|uniref:Uncharacterized protein n=1 Tax=Cardiocondyla obscurior TaxID=286306 RepID=A0AAW2GME0_9HYME